MMTSDVREFMEHLGPGDHLGCLGDDSVDLQAFVAEFLAIGVARRERILAIVDPRTPGATHRHLLAAGVDVTALTISGQLVVMPFSAFVSRNGQLDPERLVDLLLVETERAQSQDYEALRVTVDMSWLVETETSVGALLACEVRLDQVVQDQACLLLCQYGHHAYDELAPVLETHPTLIVNGQVWMPSYTGTASEGTGQELMPSHDPTTRVASEAPRRRPYDNLYQRIFGAMTEAVTVCEIVYDAGGHPADYRVLEVNAAYEIQTGISRDMALGRLITSILETREAPFLARYARVVDDHTAERFQVHYEPLDKEYEILAFALDKRRFVTVSQDVTERVRTESALRRSQARFAKAEQIAHIGSWEMEIASGRSIWSDEFFRICGFEPGAFEPTSERGMTIIHPEDRERAAKAIEHAIEETDVYDIEKRIVRPDGEVRYVHSIGEILRDEEGQAIRIIGSFLDITDRVLAEQEVAQFTEALIRSNEELERYAYVISHDLREPVRAITGFLDLLSEQFADELPATAQMYIAYALEGASRLREMIRVLIDLSRVETDGRPMARTDVEAVVRQAMTDLSVAIAEADAEIVCHQLPEIVADEAQLRQVFQNLIANAVKFRRPGVAPRVEVSATREGTSWVFEIRDNGIGFDLSQRNRLFRVFQRLHGESEYPGLGVGLALCRRIVTRHGGRIWAESEEEAGSTFYFAIPDPISIPGYQKMLQAS